MTKVLTAQPIIDENIDSLRDRCKQLTSKGINPLMKVILVGNNLSSLSYIKNKRLLCEKVGAGFDLVHLDENITSKILEDKIIELNQDNNVHGFFVQFPIPIQLRSVSITDLIDPNKDIDGFGPNAINSLYQGNTNNLMPCTPKGIITLLDHYKIPLTGKTVTIIGRSLIVGRPLSLLMQNRDATVTVCHSKTPNIKFYTQNSDIIVCALGKSSFLTKEYLNTSKNQTVIDVGINIEDGKLKGDCDFESIKDHAAAITPVPGGVGPLTVLSLIQNLLITADRK